MKTVRIALAIAFPLVILLAFLLIADSGVFGKGSSSTLTLIVGAAVVELSSGFLCGYLLRSFWALPVLPVVFTVVLLPYEILTGAYLGPDLGAQIFASILIFIVLCVVAIPAMLAALVGLLLARRAARQPSPAGVPASGRR